MNLALNINISRLYDLYDQIFDYFDLTIYDFETNFDNTESIKKLKNKLDTFSDKHFRSALNDFNDEITNLKIIFPNELFKIEKIIEEIGRSFNTLIEKKVFDHELISKLKLNLSDQLKKIQKF